MIKLYSLVTDEQELIVQLPQLKSETAYHKSCQWWFPFAVYNIQLSTKSRAAFLLLTSHSMALQK